MLSLLAVLSATPAFADPPAWCRIQCDRLYNEKPSEPDCDRYDVVYTVENGKSVEKKRFIQSCMERYFAWSDLVDRREGAAAALGDESGCLDWCTRLSEIRGDSPYALSPRKMEIWNVLADADVCGLTPEVLEDLALLEVSAVCSGMVLVPDGEFQMGCTTATPKPGKWCSFSEEELGIPCVKMPGKCELAEMPARQVTLGPYFIDRHEVTVSAYSQCVEAGVCRRPPDFTRQRFYNYGGTKRDLHPVNGVDWTDASEFCGWQGKRLCTEAEWEKGARGPDGRLYPWGDSEPTSDMAVIDLTTDRTDESLPWPLVSTTRQVCSREAGNSPYGLCDMAGNVWEWVADWYDPAYYSSAPRVDPKGPPEGTWRVIKGGRYHHVGFSVRSSIRGYFPPDERFAYLGFRCCADANYRPGR